MFQEYALFPHRDVAGNVAFGLRMTGTARAASDQRVDEVLELVGLAAFAAAESRRSRAVSSNGSRSHARSRCRPGSSCSTSRSAPWIASGAGDCSRRSAPSSTGARLAALYVTHDHEEAFAVATRVAIMRDGRVVQVGAPDARLARARRRVDGDVSRVRSGRRGRDPTTGWSRLRGARSRHGPVRGLEAWVDVVVRPDGTRVDADGPIDATVVRAMFTGTHVELAAASDSSPALTVVVSPRGRAGGRRSDPAVDRSRRTPRLPASGRLIRWQPGPTSRGRARARAS